MNDKHEQAGAEPIPAAEERPEPVAAAEAPAATAVQPRHDGVPADVADEEIPEGEYEDEEDEYEPEPARVVTINRSLFLALVAFGALAIIGLGASTAWLAFNRGGSSSNPVVATVNGEQIRRSEYDKAVAQNNGQDVLDQLVVERLIVNEAKKRNISVDQDETAKLVDEQRQQFGNDAAFQAALTQAGLTQDDFAHQLQLGAMLRHMVSDQVQVSDDEVNTMYTQNSGQYNGIDPDQAKKQVRDDLQRQKENDAARTLLGQLRTDAKIETHLPGKPAS